MKLYDVPRETYVKTITGDVYFFDHVDGMYSYCKNELNQVVHLAAWTEVEIVKNHTQALPVSKGKE